MWMLYTWFYKWHETHWLYRRCRKSKVCLASWQWLSSFKSFTSWVTVVSSLHKLYSEKNKWSSLLTHLRIQIEICVIIFFLIKVSKLYIFTYNSVYYPTNRFSMLKKWLLSRTIPYLSAVSSVKHVEIQNYTVNEHARNGKTPALKDK